MYSKHTKIPDACKLIRYIMLKAKGEGGKGKGVKWEGEKRECNDAVPMIVF